MLCTMTNWLTRLETVGLWDSTSNYKEHDILSVFSSQIDWILQTYYGNT